MREIAFLVLALFGSGSPAALAEDDLSTRGRLEIAAVGVTGTGHYAFQAMDASHLYIPFASLAWGGYLLERANTESGYGARIGLTSDGLGDAFRDASIAAVGGAAVLAAIGGRRGTLGLDRDTLPLFALYPVWGVVQQTLVQGMVSRNLDSADGWVGDDLAVTLFSAAAFSSVHFSDWRLAAGTFGMGLAFTPLYLAHGNVWPLGLYHGWLGALFYTWVLDRNPWTETFGPKDEGARAMLELGPEGEPRVSLRLAF